MQGLLRAAHIPHGQAAVCAAGLQAVLLHQAQHCHRAPLHTGSEWAWCLLLVVAPLSPAMYILSLSHMDNINILLLLQQRSLNTGVVSPLLPSEVAALP